MTKPSAGEVWQHFKGTRYCVLHVGLDTETLGEVVVYQQEGSPAGQVWVRPLPMWLEKAVAKPTGYGKYNCTHSMQDHFTTDDQMLCHACAAAAARGRFVRV